MLLCFAGVTPAAAQFDMKKALSGGLKAVKAVTLTDKQMAEYVKEYIEWSDTPEFDRKPDILHFSVNGSPENGCNAIYVRTNVPFTATVEFE